MYWKCSPYANTHIMARLYIRQIRPRLEYGTQVWHPHLATDTATLEKYKNWPKNVFKKMDQYTVKRDGYFNLAMAISSAAE